MGTVAVAVFMLVIPSSVPTARTVRVLVTS